MLRTKSQQTNLCSACGLAKTADLIGDSTVLLIIRDLLVNNARFGDLERSLNGISTRTITNKLKELENKGIITKSPIETDSRGFIYSLTESGKGLASIAEAMKQYGDTYLS